ncbi:Hypothetical predicted protein [Mytilus galloprovincialis]|uniref:LRRNT domain-containing protein n=1 Tax=Mytilus galloprovincialis TaxID=29158 RepID=A0A8B6G9A4_MYTGA|nr:Hypothetical predicted protein [Mytilus galloprovincialis]
MLIFSLQAIHLAQGQGCLNMCTCLETSVDCSFEGFTQIPNNIPSTTTRLSLSENSITSIEDHVFDGLTSLEALFLHRNNINSIEPDAFGGLQSLQILDLRENSITSKDLLSLAGLTSLSELAMESDPLVCCSMAEFVVDGGWSDWENSTCSVTCGEGTTTMTRTCNNPIPSGGGNNCSGESIDTASCNLGIPYQNLTEEEKLFLRNAHLDVDGEEENECERIESNTENNEQEKIVDTEINLTSENVQSCQVLMMEEKENQVVQNNTASPYYSEMYRKRFGRPPSLISSESPIKRIHLQEINGNQSTFFNAGITQYFDSEQMYPVELFSKNSTDDITSYIYYNEEGHLEVRTQSEMKNKSYGVEWYYEDLTDNSCRQRVKETETDINVYI